MRTSRPDGRPDSNPDALVDPDRRMPVIAVVGGGISGLAAAWHLVTALNSLSPPNSVPPNSLPPRVVVLEASPRLGGLLRTGSVGDLELDLGAESLLARRPEALELAREVGLGADVVHPATSAANVVRDGGLRPLPAGTLLGVPGDPERLRGLFTDAEVERVAAEPELLAGPGADDVPAHIASDDVDVASFVAGRVGPAVVERLVEPLLGGVYAGHADRLSLRATMPALWPAASGGGSLLAAVRAATTPGMADGSDGTHGTTHRTDRVVGTPPSPVFAGLRGGIGRLPQAVAGRLRERGVELRTDATVRDLQRSAGRWRLTLGPASEPAELVVDAVVLAVPPAPAARLLRRVAPVAAARLRSVESASVAVVSAVLPRPDLAGLPGSGVLVPPVEGRAVKAITFSSAKWGWVDALDPGAVAVRLSLGRHREEAVLQRDDAELTALALADAAALLGRPLHPRATRVARWGGALPQYAVGHLELVADVRAGIAAVPGVAVCGAAFDGVGVAACVVAARRAATQVLADLEASTSRGTVVTGTGTMTP